MSRSHKCIVALYALISVGCQLGDGSNSGPPCSRSASGCPELRYVPLEGGSFQMGLEFGNPDELPQHEVTVPPFQLTRTEVTVSTYRACVQAEVCSAPGVSAEACTWTPEAEGGESLPVNCVSWHQAMELAAWLGARLPTEAEWAFAARGREGRRFPWGEEAPTCFHAQYQACEAQPTEVCDAYRGESPEGICDLAGNVWEWVQDEWHDSYEGSPTDGSGWCDGPCPRHADDLSYYPDDSRPRVLRGGSWQNGYSGIQSANRAQFSPNYQSAHYGIRLARSAPGAEGPEAVEGGP